MLISEIKLLVEGWVCSQFAGKVIWINADMPIPPRPFITLSLKNPKPLGHAYQGPADEQGKNIPLYDTTVQCNDSMLWRRSKSKPFEP